MEKATPRPWRLCTRGNLGSAIEVPSGKSYYDGDDGYRVIASYQECTDSGLYAVQESNRIANGELILRAVNSYDRLLAFAQYVANLDPGNPAPLFAKARAALAPAQAEQS
jgi:hypothetical protein